jgi:hypothetical protein
MSLESLANVDLFSADLVAHGFSFAHASRRLPIRTSRTGLFGSDRKDVASRGFGRTEKPLLVKAG